MGKFKAVDVISTRPSWTNKCSVDVISPRPSWTNKCSKTFLPNNLASEIKMARTEPLSPSAGLYTVIR